MPQRITRAQIIQLYEFASVEEVEQFFYDAVSAAAIILDRQGINHPVLNPKPMAEGSAEASDVPATEADKTGDSKVPDTANGPSDQKMIGGFPADFPFAAKLVDGGITDVDAVIKATDNEITFIPGIGPAALAKIRAAQAA